LATSLASSLDVDYHVTVSARRLLFPKHNLEMSEVHTVSTSFEPRDWRFPIIDYALHDILPDNPKEAIAIKRMAEHFHYNVELKTLFRRTRDGLLHRCLAGREAQEVLQQAHDGICGAHQPGPRLHDRIQ